MEKEEGDCGYGTSGGSAAGRGMEQASSDATCLRRPHFFVSAQRKNRVRSNDRTRRGGATERVRPAARGGANDTQFAPTKRRLKGKPFRMGFPLRIPFHSRPRSKNHPRAQRSGPRMERRSREAQTRKRRRHKPRRFHEAQPIIPANCLPISATDFSRTGTTDGMTRFRS